jgi:hypothetical protein
MGFCPDEIVSHYPARLLHSDSEARWYQEELLVVKPAAGRSFTALSGLSSKSLTPIRPDARPSTKVSVADVDPQVAF